MYDVQAVLAQSHRSLVLTSKVHFFRFSLFIQILIDLCPLSRGEFTKTALVVIPNNLWWNAPMLYHLWCQTNAALMRTSINNTLFPVTAQPDWLMCQPLGQKKNILELLHLVPLDRQFHHMQRHVRWHVHIFHTHIHQRPLYMMDACQNCVMLDAMAKNQLGDQNCSN